ncbi:MAG TPA: hypothetical protein VM600_08020, partial [Actinomycetota bacterium]|nr:hypothetical protein [Actinomycetota bacterium]
MTVVLCTVAIACTGSVSAVGAPSGAAEASDAGSWSVTSFFDDTDVFVSAGSIAGHGDRPAAAVLDSRHARVLYASDPLGGSGFEVVPLEVPASGAPTLDLEIEPDGTPHIFVVRDNGTTYTFGYASRTATGWVTESAVSTGPRVMNFQLHGGAVDASGTAHALISMVGTTSIYVRTPNGWILRPVGVSTAFPHIATSPTGSIHVCANTVEGVVHMFGDPLGAWMS